MIHIVHYTPHHCCVVSVSSNSYGSISFSLPITTKITLVEVAIGDNTHRVARLFFGYKKVFV